MGRGKNHANHIYRQYSSTRGPNPTVGKWAVERQEREKEATEKPKNGGEKLQYAALKLVNSNLPLGYSGSLKRTFTGHWELLLSHPIRKPQISCYMDDKESNKVVIRGHCPGYFFFDFFINVLYLGMPNFKEQLRICISEVSNRIEIQIAERTGCA